MAVYQCGTESRRNAVRASALNGIDFLDVDPGHTQLAVHFLRPLPGEAGGVPANTPLTAANIAIEGGTRIRGIRVTAVASAGDVATITVDRPGDFSTYTLRLVAGGGSGEPPPGFDRRLAAIPFSFAVDCPSPFDCEQPEDCPEPEDTPPGLDYLAKDYGSFRRLMLDRMALVAPELRERNPADAVVATIEALAYAADQLSYFQDAVATEAYLGAARRRTSLRRHSRLLDYPMHEGCSGRTFVCLEADAAGLLLRGTRFFAADPGEPVAHPADALARPLPGRPVFESLHSLAISPLRNRYELHTFSDLDCCLPEGARSATLRMPAGGVDFGGIAPGDYLALEEGIDPGTIGEAAAGAAARHPNPANRHVVRLTSVSASYRDEVEGVDVIDVAWSGADALPFSLCISQTRDESVTEGMTVARGNVVLCDHGQTVAPLPLDPTEPEPERRYRPELPFGSVSFVNAYRHTPAAAAPSAAAALATDPRAARAAVTLRSRIGEWTAQRDLLAAGPFGRAFVVEREDDATTLRFGDGRNGRAPSAGLGYAAVLRVGGGAAGNIGSDTLSAVAGPLAGTASDDTVDAVVAGVTRVWNPLPAAGGVDPESATKVRRYAPVAFRQQERAINEAEYAEVAQRHPGVQRAAAAFRWTGSWYTVFLAIDRRDGITFAQDPAFESELLAFIERFRLAGYDIELVDPVFVPVDVALRVCVGGAYFRAAVEQRLREAFSARVLPDGACGFFHPDRFSFGQALYVSQLVEAAMRVTGVETVAVETFQRRLSAPAGELAGGAIAVGPTEIIRADNDPSFPENGSVQFTMEGGR